MLMEISGVLTPETEQALKEACAKAGVALEDLLESLRCVALHVADAVHAAAESFNEVVKSWVEGVWPQISSLIPIAEMCTESYWDFVPPRVRYLAFHSRKGRVRKKNWSRMWEIHERRTLCHKN